MFFGRIRMVDRPVRRAAFGPGDLVRHRRYGYRGVVVDVDERCAAPDSWYSKNETRPARDQAWYHVLVHGGDRMTYAAEENLAADGSGQPVDHPLVSHFFSALQDGAYVRNDAVWPGWGD